MASSAAVSPAPSGGASPRDGAQDALAGALASAAAAPMPAVVASALHHTSAALGDEATQATIASAVETALAAREVRTSSDAVATLRSVHGSSPLWFLRTLHSLVADLGAWWTDVEEGEAPVPPDPALTAWEATLAAAAWPPAHYTAPGQLAPGGDAEAAVEAAAAAAVPIANAWHVVCRDQGWYGVLARSDWGVVDAFLSTYPGDPTAALLNSADVRGKYAAMAPGERTVLWARLLSAASLLRLWAVLPDSLVAAVVQVLHGVQEGQGMHVGTLLDWLVTIKASVTSAELVALLRDVAQVVREMGGAGYFMRMLQLPPEDMTPDALGAINALLDHLLTAMASLDEGQIDSVVGLLADPSQRAALRQHMEGTLVSQAESAGGSSQMVSTLKGMLDNPDNMLQAAVAALVGGDARTRTTSAHLHDVM